MKCCGWAGREPGGDGISFAEHHGQKVGERENQGAVSRRPEKHSRQRDQHVLRPSRGRECVKWEPCRWTDDEPGR